MIVLGFILAGFVGVSLGLMGSGGSILTVPILVYVMGVDPVTATAYSLFIVGTTSLLGAIQSGLKKNVDFNTVLIFGIPSILVVYATRKWLLPLIPVHLLTIDSLTITKPLALLLLFAGVMIPAAISMIRAGKKEGWPPDTNTFRSYNYTVILLSGILVGILTGLVGAGGGFLIIPALVLFAHMPMKTASGTSLSIIAINALAGFAGDLQGNMAFDWKLAGSFTAFAVAGIFAGMALAKKIKGHTLKTTFGWFVLIMGIYIIVKELFFG
jgi:uncharacterized protein